jgi:carboxymethylenebutenolidase
VPHRIEWYPQAEHGFVFPLRAGMYQCEAAERYGERLFEMLGWTLRS